MINIIWVALFLIGMGYAAVNGTMDKVNKELFDSASAGIQICIGLISILIFWLGLMKIAEKSGLLEKLSNVFKPVMKWIFPEVPPDHPAMGYILSNTISNLFGLGNAATPMGIKAMEELKKLNGGRNTPSRSMITLLALNTSGLTLIPTTVIAIRMQNHASSPTDIVGPTLIATCCTTLAALVIDRYFYHRRKRKGRK
ncbi:nucleoside recognition domain-containing protein [Sporolactobacillus laevolacticus]|jgi:spore maturation protein A|uniref:Spore maturation protein n=1 Tax=Sporolactobacillus laevolacticus DSM 442 TaxID=1395513 RepID=V6IWQ1_9BACL|nr:nucleoside recognition domain-containing protein [Sporolactobacillus laevolacticus]EST11692.1 spore maturation protein [Sporolactobacillus laevolacticus DSM 442]MDF2909789.1 spore maturation protein [Sporolactobacillus laevolacticus]MDN3953617.1 nucleoside recognition domain-containing protein [Sporolactobacillus laevolacticus]